MLLIFFVLQRLRDESIDFLKARTLKTVQQILKNCLRSLNQKIDDKKTLKDVKKSCRLFFMNLLCDLTFRGQFAPESDLIVMLLDMIFKVDDEFATKELIPFEDKADKIPTIRSFLLQLLLEHR